MGQIHDDIMREYDTRLTKYFDEGRYIDAYKYIFKQKNIVHDLDKNIYSYLILWQILTEIYLDIIDDAKEHFLNIFNNVSITKRNLVLFIKCVLLLDEFDMSLKIKELYDELMNYEDENLWINIYIFLLTLKNKRRNYDIKDELLYMMQNIDDKLLLSLLHSIMAEILKLEGDERWKDELKKAKVLNPHNLYMLRCEIDWGLIETNDLKKNKYFRYFPDKKNILRLYYDIYKQEPYRDMEDFKFSLIEGGSTGGSSYLITYQGINILLDCGINFKDGKIFYSDLKGLEIDIKNIDLLIVTHCHLDHCGGIISFINNGLNCPIIMSKETLHILNGIFSKNYNIHDLNINIDEQLSFNMLNDMVFTGLNYESVIKNKKVRIKLIPSGHIIGACAAYIDVNGFSIFYTGDFTVKDVESNNGLSIPDGMHADVLITEATFGYTSNFSVYNKEIQDQLILNTISDLIDHGIVFIPVFAVGKAQDMLLLLKRSYDYIPYNVYVDGALSYITTLYEKMIGTIYGNGILNANDIKLYSSKREFIKKEISLGNCLVMTSSDNLTDGSTSLIYGRELMCFNNAILLNISNNLRKPIAMSQENIPLLNHGIVQDIIEVFLKLTPRQVYLVHRGAKSNIQFNIEEVLKWFNDISVITP
ncbi:MBL fold metallo-hydrolase [Thermoanaerobacterium sp. RBIITD]|uniref:MBL fold metallo-hydrolase n=1 Tax=Thermoanaerobacterium sp. RBIITD TaxID=1550240 RepID=UPI001E4C8CD0|nr:MBL fold metallo-hydrolase [Thermoanaerobacterium sp. RBIITD]